MVELSGGPVAANSTIPRQGAWVQSLVKELDPHMTNQEFPYHIEKILSLQLRPDAAE